jgi:hypothetical protein
LAFYDPAERAKNATKTHSIFAHPPALRFIEPLKGGSMTSAGLVNIKQFRAPNMAFRPNSLASLVADLEGVRASEQLHRLLPRVFSPERIALAVDADQSATEVDVDQVLVAIAQAEATCLVDLPADIARSAIAKGFKALATLLMIRCSSPQEREMLHPDMLDDARLNVDLFRHTFGAHVARSELASLSRRRRETDRSDAVAMFAAMCAA